MRNLLTIVLAVMLMAVGSIAGAASIGVNLGSNEMSLATGDVAGVVAQNNWNNASGSNGSLTNMKDNSGTIATADVNWTAPGTWRVSANGTATGDAKLMYGYIDAQWGDQPAIATLSEIPYGMYDVYVYFGSNNAGHTGRVILNEGSTPTATYWFTNAANNPGGDGFQAADYVLATTIVDVLPYAPGNYAKFAGLTASSVTVTVRKGSDNEGMFAVQIVEAGPSYVATDPSPAYGAVSVSINADLSWTAGVSAASHDVYFGTSQAAVTAASRLAGDINGSGSVDINDITVLAEQWLGAPIEPCADLDGDDDVNIADFAVVSAEWLDSADSVYKGNQAGVTFEPGTMAGSTTYYWRIDEVNCGEPGSPWTGDVWSFTTESLAPGQASSPSPANGAGGVNVDADLSWTAGSGATSHNVYFGTDATPDSGEFKGNQSGTTYDPGTMVVGTIYYWRIDEVNVHGTTTGAVWNFATTGGSSGDVGRYAMFEKEITNTYSYSNPFTGTTLTATFTSPSSQQTVVYGFYAGGQTWKVRFMPNQLGQWSYVALFSDSAPGASGAFQCVSSSLHGPLEVNTTDDNSKQWFRHADGTAFYMRSFHLWFVDTLESQGHLTDTLDYLHTQGFNTINGPHLWPKSSGGAAARTLAPWVSTGYETWDFSRFDLTEWQRLDTVLTQLANRNMVLVPFSIMLGTNGQPRIDTPANRDLFLRYWVARWGGFWNATFQPFSEWEEDYSESDVLAIINRIYELDGGRHLVSVHPLYRGTSGVQNATAYSYHTIQDKLASYNNYMKYVNTFGGLYYSVKKPMLAHECLWEGNLYQGNVGLDMGQMRRGAWVIALSGGQINYCDEVIIPRGYQTTYFENSFSVIGKAMEPQGWLYPYLDILGDLMESLPLAQMGQNSTISSTQTCLFTHGVRYVTYAPNGGTFTVNLTGTSGTFDGQWLNPRTGAWGTTFNVEGGAVRNVTAPDTDDWVLRLVHQ